MNLFDAIWAEICWYTELCVCVCVRVGDGWSKVKLDQLLRVICS
jgi:hypothetical protein